MLVVFMLDTSASMNQRCNNGLTLLDCAKSAIEQFHKVRLRDTSVRMDRYMLVTCEEGSSAIRVLDKYPFLNFMHIVKSIQARDLTSIGVSLQCVFSFLHLQHLTAEIDKFGQGRNPVFIEPTMVMLITDGTELTSMTGVLPTVSQSLLPSTPAPVGAELVMQPFRWDQRVFATILRIPSANQVLPENNGISHHAVAMDNMISAICESTGGKCFVATSWKIMLQHIELTAARLASSVIVAFDQALPSGSAAISSQANTSFQRRVMFVKGGQMQGHWPIPECYWPDSSHPELPPREPHPVISYKPMEIDSYIPPNFVYDKYELESNTFMNLPHKATVGTCWQVFIRNSKGINHGLGDPFGFIRLNHGGSITLFILPYNYPVLWQLLKQVVKPPGSTTAKLPLNPQWRQDMERYCNGIPPYYAPALRVALKRWGLLAHIVPESLETPWLSFLGTYLKRIKAQAKPELDTMMSHILTEDKFIGSNNHLASSLPNRSLPIFSTSSPLNSDAPPGFISNLSNTLPAMQAQNVMCADLGNSWKGWEAMGPSVNAWQSLSGASLSSGSANVSGYLHGCRVGNNHNGSHGSNGAKSDIIFKNPFDVPKDQLIRQLISLPVRVTSVLQTRRTHTMDKGTRKFKSPVNLIAAKLIAKEEEEWKHSLPVEKMGDFNEALLKQQPPRNPFIEDLDRNKQQRPMFGNPFRQERSDGADETWQEGLSGPLSRGRKKRRAEVLGVPSSSPGYTLEGSLDSIPANEAAPLTKILMDSPGIGENLLVFGMMSHNIKSMEKNNETAEVQSSNSPIHEAQSQKERGSHVCDENVDDVRMPSAVEAIDKERLKIERFLGENMGEGTKISVNHVEDTLLTKQRKVAITMTLGPKKDPHDIAGFIIAVFRTLRHTKQGNTQKLFEILSVPDFPVDKCSFLEQLIQQAYRYNKRTVAEELSEYRSQMLCKVASTIVKA